MKETMRDLKIKTRHSFHLKFIFVFRNFNLTSVQLIKSLVNCKKYETKSNEAFFDQFYYCNYNSERLCYII